MYATKWYERQANRSDTVCECVTKYAYTYITLYVCYICGTILVVSSSYSVSHERKKILSLLKRHAVYFHLPSRFMYVTLYTFFLRCWHYFLFRFFFFLCHSIASHSFAIHFGNSLLISVHFKQTEFCANVCFALMFLSSHLYNFRSESLEINVEHSTHVNASQITPKNCHTLTYTRAHAHAPAHTRTIYKLNHNVIVKQAAFLYELHLIQCNQCVWVCIDVVVGFSVVVFFLIKCN